jgi:hypothetical protein
LISKDVKQNGGFGRRFGCGKIVGVAGVGTVAHGFEPWESDRVMIVSAS